MKNVRISFSEQIVLFFLSSSLITVYLFEIFYNILSFIFIPKNGAIDFCVYCSDPIHVSKNIPAIQFILIPILFASIFRKSNLIFSFTFAFLSVSLYFYWIFETFVGRKTFEVYYLAEETIFSYLMNKSDFFDFASFILIFVIFILHMFLIFRFAIDSFQVKIS